MTRHSMMTSECSTLWTLIHTHSFRIETATLFALEFLWISDPVAEPQNPSLLLWECFCRALAPTESLEMFFILFSSSTLKSWFGRLKFYRRIWGDGQGNSCDPVVFLNPSMVKTPLGPTWVKNFLSVFSTLWKSATLRAMNRLWTFLVWLSLRLSMYSNVSSLTFYPIKRGSNLMGKHLK